MSLETSRLLPPIVSIRPLAQVIRQASETHRPSSVGIIVDDPKVDHKVNTVFSQYSQSQPQNIKLQVKRGSLVK